MVLAECVAQRPGEQGKTAIFKIGRRPEVWKYAAPLRSGLPGVPCMLVHVKIQDHLFLRARQTRLDTWQQLVGKDMM